MLHRGWSADSVATDDECVEISNFEMYDFVERGIEPGRWKRRRCEREEEE